MELKYLNHEELNLNPDAFSIYTDKLRDEIELLKGTLNVIFVNDIYIQALNKAYRDMDRPTDVLSFNYEQEDSELDGEIYISFETAERQAKEHGHGFEDELIKLIVHGILHVHGFDHEEDEDYREMYEIERLILGEIAGPYVKK